MKKFVVRPRAFQTVPAKVGSPFGLPGEWVLIGRLAGASERDPNDAIYEGPLARALPVEPGPVLSASPTFSIQGTPADVSESFGATKGVVTTGRSTHMALYMDVHSLDGEVTVDDVAQAHAADLDVQDAHDVNYLRYWVSPGAGKIFCLVQAPDAESANEVHRKAHGLVASEIYPVSEHA